jgi:phage baseplate assembly protein V
MTSTNEILRRIDNIVQIGTICEIKPNKALAKVNILNRVTNFMPVMSFANSFKRHFTPIKIGEQALVICIGGQADNGVIIRSIFYKKNNHKEPAGSNENIEISEYSDGTKIKYDIEKHKLMASVAGDVELFEVNGNVKINTTGNMEITAGGDIKLKAAKIFLNE